MNDRRFRLISYLLWLFCASSAAQAATPAPLKLDEARLQQTFKIDPKVSSCRLLLQKDIDERRAELPKLAERIADIVALLNTQDAKGLSKRFHERMKISKDRATGVFKLIGASYGAPFQASLYEAYLAYSADSAPEYLRCEDSRLEVLPQYGYPFQVIVWLQIMGEREVGRLVFSLVPHKDNWVMGSFHSWQWTHEGLDYQKWYEKALAMKAAKDNIGAYVHADIAEKLLNAKPYMKFDDVAVIASLKEDLLSGEAFKAEIGTLLQPRKIGHAATTFVDGGVGLLARIQLPAEITSMAMRKDCEEAAKAISISASLKMIKGIRCAYHLPGESLEKDGSLGSLFYPTSAK